MKDMSDGEEKDQQEGTMSKRAKSQKGQTDMSREWQARGKINKGAMRRRTGSFRSRYQETSRDASTESIAMYMLKHREVPAKGAVIATS